MRPSKNKECKVNESCSIVDDDDDGDDDDDERVYACGRTYASEN